MDHFSLAFLSISVCLRAFCLTPSSLWVHGYLNPKQDLPWVLEWLIVFASALALMTISLSLVSAITAHTIGVLYYCMLCDAIHFRRNIEGEPRTKAFYLPSNQNSLE